MSSFMYAKLLLMHFKSIQRMIPLCMQVFLEGTFSVFLHKVFQITNIIIFLHSLIFLEPSSSSFRFFLCIGINNSYDTFSIFLQKDTSYWDGTFSIFFTLHMHHMERNFRFFPHKWKSCKDIFGFLHLILIEHLMCSSL